MAAIYSVFVQTDKNLIKGSIQIMMAKNNNLHVQMTSPLSFRRICPKLNWIKRTPYRALQQKIYAVSERQTRIHTSRQQFLKNFWYVVGLSNELRSKPIGVKALGMNLLLFRDRSGLAHALDDICPHRGAPLHDGWLDQHGCIVCPYHGWAFDQEGVLRDVPAAVTNQEFPQRKMLETYIVKELGGFVWLFHGDNSAPKPPIPDIPELHDPKWRPAYGSIDFDCNHFSVFENAIDMAHIHYLHAGSFGNQNKPQIKDMKCSTEDLKVTGTFSLHNKPANPLWNFSKIAQVNVTATAFLPSTSMISFTLGRGLSFTTFVNTTPIDHNRSCNRFALIRRLDVDPIGSKIFNSKYLDIFATAAMIKILTEDKSMVERLNPSQINQEISVKADMLQILFRRLRSQFEMTTF